MESVTDYVTENQRRVLRLPGVFAAPVVTDALNIGLDQQYERQHLLSHDPSPWVDENNGTIASPGALPLKEVSASRLHCSQNSILCYE